VLLNSCRKKLIKNHVFMNPRLRFNLNINEKYKKYKKNPNHSVKIDYIDRIHND
jgi:hypothetical protein